MTICSFAIMSVLFVSEFRDYLSVDLQETAFVDPNYDSRAMLSADLDVRFQKLSCENVRVDATDKSGTVRSNIDEGLQMSPHGKGGCRLHGTINVKKVAGDFHVAAGEKRDEKDALVYKIDLRKLSEFDVTHKIERLVFGDQVVSINDVEGNPLNNYQSQGEGTMTQFKYHITIVRCVCFLSVEPGVIQNTHTGTHRVHSTRRHRTTITSILSTYGTYHDRSNISSTFCSARCVLSIRLFSDRNTSHGKTNFFLSFSHKCLCYFRWCIHRIIHD